MIYIYISKKKVGDQKAPFSIATTQRWTLLLSLNYPSTLDTYLIMLRVKKGGIKYHYFSFTL